MFKASAAMFVLLALPSCTVAHGDATKGTYFYATVGGDAKKLEQTATGITAGSLDTSNSFREINKTGRAVITAAAATAAARDMAGSWKSVTNTRTKTEAATKQAGIGAELEKVRILNPPPIIE